MKAPRKACQVPDCSNPAAFGRGAFPGRLCFSHGKKWAISMAQSRVKEICAQWAEAQPMRDALERPAPTVWEKVKAEALSETCPDHGPGCPGQFGGCVP